MPLPFGLCPRLWDSGHVPVHEVDDVAIYGSGLGRREHWPAWLLVRPPPLPLANTHAYIRFECFTRILGAVIKYKSVYIDLCLQASYNISCHVSINATSLVNT